MMRKFPLEQYVYTGEQANEILKKFISFNRCNFHFFDS
jgi:hypothetical protein